MGSNIASSVRISAVSYIGSNIGSSTGRSIGSSVGIA